MSPFLDSLHESKLNERLRDGLKAYVWLYYRDFTDATNLDRDTIFAMQKLLEDVSNDLYLDEIVTETEAEINAAGGVMSQTENVMHKVGPTYNDDGELI